MTDIVWVATSCAMILAVILIRAIFGKKMSAGLRYALWALVLLRLLIPGTVLSSPVSVESAVTASETISDMEAVRGVRSVSRSENGVVSGVPRASRPRASAPQTGLPDGQQGNAPQSADTAPEERVIIGSATPERFERIKKTVKLTDVLSTVWYCGMAATAAWFLFVNLRTYFSLRKRRVRLETELKCPVYAVEGISSSCLFLNSVYISKETAEDETERRFVLAHENAHRRHGDGFTVLLRSIALILHWYNPLAWTAAILSRRDAELFADAGAIASLGEEERQNYGLTLIGLSSRFKPRADICVAATAMTGGKKELKERIKHMAKKTKTRVIIAAAVTALALAALGISFLGCKSSPADPNAGTEPTENAAEAPVTEAPAQPVSWTAEELLPDWPNGEEGDDGWVNYPAVTPEMVRTYLDESVQKGFTLVEYKDENLNGPKMLYTQGAWIEVSDNTHLDEEEGHCNVRVLLERHTAGMDAARAAAVIGNGCMEYAPAAVIEQTPEGFCEETGFQVFRALYKLPAYYPNACETRDYLVCENDWHELTYIIDYVTADMNGDGAEDLLLMEHGGSSGIFTAAFAAINVKDGMINVLGSSAYGMHYGRFDLEKRTDGVYLLFAGALYDHDGDDITVEYDDEMEFPVRLENGEIIIEDNGEAISGLWMDPWKSEPTEEPGEFVPEGCNAHDYLALADFFALYINDYECRIGDLMFDHFNVKDPSTWKSFSGGVTWDNEGYATEIVLDPTVSKLHASLELVGFKRLRKIDIGDDLRIERFAVLDCPMLTDGCSIHGGISTWVAQVETGFVESLRLEAYSRIDCKLMGDKYPFELDINAEGAGRVCVATASAEGKYRVRLTAAPDENVEFLGWYDAKDNFVTAERVLELSGGDIAEPISGMHAYTARFAAPPAPTPVPDGDFFCEILPNVPSSIDVDGDGREDTVLIASLGEGNSWEGFEVTVTRAADPAHPLSYITQTGGDGVAMAADCDPNDNRVEIILCFDVESNDYVTCAFRVNEAGDGLEHYEAWFDSSYGNYFYEPGDYVFDHTRGLPMTKRSEILGTNYNVGRFTVTKDGIEDITEEYYYWDWKNPDHPSCVLLRDMEVTLENGETRTLHKGETFRPYSTDHESWAKVKLEDGSIGRVEITFGNQEYKYPVFINGIIQDEYTEIDYAD